MAYIGQRFNRFSNWYGNSSYYVKQLGLKLSNALNVDGFNKPAFISSAINYSFKVKGNWIAMKKMRSSLKTALRQCQSGDYLRAERNLRYAVGILRNL